MLYTFTGGADGGLPFAGVIRDSAGNLYGTTASGGQGAGVVFKLDTTGQETALYSFTNGTDGGYPYGGVIRDSAGNLYGTTVSGPVSAGAVFKLDTTGHETVLYSFPSGTDGDQPVAGVDPRLGRQSLWDDSLRRSVSPGRRVQGGYNGPRDGVVQLHRRGRRGRPQRRC